MGVAFVGVVLSSTPHLRFSGAVSTRSTAAALGLHGGGGGAGRGYPFFALVHREGGDARELLGGGGACQLRRWRRQLQRRRTAHGGENGQAAEHCR